MPKFKVRPGYAYFPSRSVKPVAAGEIVELEDINVGGQAWKLEKAEQAVAEPVEAPAPVSLPDEAPVVEIPVESPVEAPEPAPEPEPTALANSALRGSTTLTKVVERIKTKKGK